MKWLAEKRTEWLKFRHVPEPCCSTMLAFSQPFKVVRKHVIQRVARILDRHRSYPSPLGHACGVCCEPCHRASLSCWDFRLLANSVLLHLIQFFISAAFCRNGNVVLARTPCGSSLKRKRAILAFSVIAERSLT